MELNEIETLLISEGFEVVPGTVTMNGAEQPKLTVGIDLEDGKEALALELLFVPGIDQGLEGCRLLQFFIAYLDSVEDFPPEQTEVLTSLLSDLNFNAPLGAFGIRNSDRMLYYKYMMIVPPEMSAEAEATLSETVWLIRFIQSQCYPAIAGVLE